MPRAEPERKTRKVCVRLYEDNLAYLREVAEANSDLGYNLLVRQIVNDYCMRLKDRENRAIDQRPKIVEPLEIEL